MGMEGDSTDAAVTEKPKNPAEMTNEERRELLAQQERDKGAKQAEREQKIDAAYRNLDLRQNLARKQEELRAQMNEPDTEDVKKMYPTPELRAARQKALEEAYAQTDRDFMKANAESEQLARELGVSSDVVDSRNIRR